MITSHIDLMENHVKGFKKIFHIYNLEVRKEVKKGCYKFRNFFQTLNCLLIQEFLIWPILRVHYFSNFFKLFEMWFSCLFFIASIISQFIELYFYIFLDYYPVFATVGSHKLNSSSCWLEDILNNQIRVEYPITQEIGVFFWKCSCRMGSKKVFYTKWFSVTISQPLR